MLRKISLLDREPAKVIEEEKPPYVPLACPDCERRRRQAHDVYWRNREKKQAMARKYYHAKKRNKGHE
jgi:hypothetical protein